MPETIARFNEICGGQTDAVHVPLLWPVIWVSRPEVRKAVFARCGSTRIPFHTRQIIEYSAPLLAATTYHQAIHLTEDRNSVCDLSVIVTTSSGDIVCKSTSKISLLDRTQASLARTGRSSGKTGTAPTTSPDQIFGSVDQSRISAYADLSGDNNPIHLDAAAANTFNLPGPIAHGALIAAIMTNRLSMCGDRCSLDFTFTGPLIAGENMATELKERGGSKGKVLRAIARKPDGQTIAIAGISGDFSLQADELS